MSKGKRRKEQWGKGERWQEEGNDKENRGGKGMKERKKRREGRIIGSNLSQIPAFVDKVFTLQVNITCKNEHHKSRNLNFPFSTIFQ